MRYKGVTTVNFVISNNAWWDDVLQFGDPADTSWSFNGVSFVMDLKTLPTAVTPSLSLSSAAGTIVVDDNVQRILNVLVSDHVIRSSLLVMTDPTTVNPDGSTVGVYFYDLIMVNNTSGERDMLMTGIVKVSQGVTIED